MSRSRRSRGRPGTLPRPTGRRSARLLFLTALVLSALLAFEIQARTTWSPGRSFGAVALGILALILVARLLGFDRVGRTRRRLLGMTLDELDRLDGAAFEVWIAAMLREAGFRVWPTRKGHDFGVDLVAERDGLRIGIEAKRRGTKVANDVVRSVVAGCQFHRCDVAAVVTQSAFTAAAERQAEAAELPVVLVGRRDLLRLRETLLGVRPR